MARTKQIGLFISDEENAKLNEISKQEDMSKSQIIRRAIKEYYEKHKNN